MDKYSDLNIIDVDYDKNEYILKCDKCGSIYRINKKVFTMRLNKYKTIICTACNPIDNHISGQEIQLQDFIKDNYDDEIILNSRKIISPLELDIYLPKIKLAFEFNGTYWHSEIFRDINYHKNKLEKCKEKNIELIHIWEEDWNKKRDEIKLMILDVMNRKLIKENKCIMIC